MSTREIVERIEAALVGVTPGPSFCPVACNHRMDTPDVRCSEVDRNFIAAARTLLPECLAELERLEARLKAADKVVAAAREEGAPGICECETCKAIAAHDSLVKGGK